MAISLTIGIGGPGGGFAPFLFVGAMSGMVFGEIAVHVAQRRASRCCARWSEWLRCSRPLPLTSLASVLEMTGDFALSLPVMLAVSISSVISWALSYGTIYNLNLLRRGTDIDRCTPSRSRT